MAYKPKKKIKEEIRKEVFETFANPSIESLSGVDNNMIDYIYPNDLKPEAKHPDPKLHQIVSFIKSGMRIIGYCLIPYNLGVAASMLVLSEVVGIIEELV
tara:strand:+ start:1136 stop:1435 length:300 start_codon:yes stop_codon:yes gene_type:complete